MNVLLPLVLSEDEEVFTSMESTDDAFEGQVDWFQPDEVFESEGLLWILAS